MKHPALSRSPRTVEELTRLVEWGFGPRVKIEFTDVKMDGRDTVLAQATIDGASLVGSFTNGCLVGSERHNAFYGKGWLNLLAMEPPVYALATPEFLAYEQGEE